MAGATSTGLSVRFLIVATAFGLSACEARTSRTLNNLVPARKNSFCGGRFSGSVFGRSWTTSCGLQICSGRLRKALAKVR